MLEYLCQDCRGKFYIKQEFLQEKENENGWITFYTYCPYCKSENVFGQLETEGEIKNFVLKKKV